MRTAYETISVRFTNKKRIETHLSKGQHRMEEIYANVFFCQTLMRGFSVEEAKEETEFAYPSIQVNIVELKPIKMELHEKMENWKVWFDYMEEST